MVADNFHYELFLNSIKTVLILVDEKLNISFVNEAALNLLATGVSQIKERPLHEFFIKDSFNAKQLKKAFEKNKDFSDTEVQIIFKDGRNLLVDINANIIYANDKKQILIEMIPVGKQRKITKETQQYAQQNAAKELVRGLAHEIKNPLGGIRGAAQLLEKELHDPQQKEFTKMIIGQSDRLRNLVDRLLGPNSLPQKRNFNLHEVIDKVDNLICADQLFHIETRRDYDPSIPDIFADPDMLEQAILNIARNASQALSDAKINDPLITFKSRIERQCVIKGERYALCAKISVIDNGPGIPADIRDTLFYPMVTTKENGSGLGLSIAQNLTDHHHGKIDLKSFPGFTEFTLYIPISKKDKDKQ